MVAVLEELVNSLYETIQDAKSLPLSSEKCVIEREQVLDILDEIRANMPSDLKMAKEIVEKRNAIIASGKKEAESLRTKAEEYVRKTVSESAVVAQANAQARDIITEAEKQAGQLRLSTQQYCEGKLNDLEGTTAEALAEIQALHQRFINAGQAMR
jgi:cell division septum initiation protein DivIVA